MDTANFALTEFLEVPTISCSGILSDEAVYRRIQHRLYSARMFDGTRWRTTTSIPLSSGIATAGIGPEASVGAPAFLLPYSPE